MNLYIVRHGQTELNAEHRAQGRNGKTLNEVGIEQAKEYYKNRIYSFINEITEKYKNQKINILVVGHKCTTGMLSAYFDGFKVDTIYDDYLKLASENCGYKKYII